MEAASLFDRSPDREAVRRFLQREDHHLLLAYLGSAPVGFALAHELHRLDGPAPKLLLYEIGTAPAFRRRGIARSLIAALKELATSRGARSVFAITDEGNPGAMRLYSATGGVRKSTTEAVVEYIL